MLYFSFVGAWRSLVAHLLWEQRVGGSNPLAPTKKNKYLRGFPLKRKPLFLSRFYACSTRGIPEYQLQLSLLFPLRNEVLTPEVSETSDEPIWRMLAVGR